MLVSFSHRKERERPIQSKFRGRTGHRLARMGDSLFVIGGVDRQGTWTQQVQRINTQNHRIDSILMDNTICLEGFSLFSYQQSLYLWGGLSNRSNTNQLLHFDGSRFTLHRQTGLLPSPRSYHFSVTFGGKYLIVFGGCDDQQFFKDWYLLNMKTFEWKRLIPSIDVGFANGGSMIWLGGRGVLMLNEVFDQKLKRYTSNKFFQFYVSDFKRNYLTVQPLDLEASIFQQNIIFTNISAFSNDSFLVFGGYYVDDMKKSHKLSFMVDLQNNTIDKAQIETGSLLGFESIFYKNELYLIGGQKADSSLSQAQTFIFQSLKSKGHNFKRHVCEMCKLYYDQEWSQTTKQIYKNSQPKQQFDYGYNMKLDNRVLQKFSSYIRDEFYAFTLLLSCLHIIGVKYIDTTFNKVKRSMQRSVIESQGQYLKISCKINEELLGNIANSLAMSNIFDCPGIKDSKQSHKIQMALLRLKLSTYKLSNSTIISFKINKDEVLVVYYSSSQLECTHTYYESVPCYSYIYNNKKKTCSESIYRSIIHQNVKTIFMNPSIYQDLGQFNMNLVSFCSQSLENQLILLQHSVEPQTGDISLLSSGKDQYKRSVPLIQLSFLSNQDFPSVFIDNNHLTFINLHQLLQGDQKLKTLQAIDLMSLGITPSKRIFEKISLFNHPEEYWYKRVLVYHQGRLISHFKQGQSKICGIIELNGRVELDLGGTNLARYRDKLIVQTFLEELKSLKLDNQL